MKKELNLFFIFLFLINFFIVNVYSLEIQSPEQTIGINIDNLPRNEDEAKDVTKEYLKQEWDSILERGQFGRFLLGVNKIFVALSPFFKSIIGVEYSLSWYFFISLFLWVFIFIIIFHTLKDIILFNIWGVIGISCIIPTIAAQANFFKLSVDFLLDFIDNAWLVITFLLLMLITIYFYEAFMNSFGKIMKKKLNKDIERRRELKAATVERLHDIELKSRGS
ncbi:MAG: hypothetical protein QXI33_00660 [Candidatus Pacearchaeota archaeon]